MVTMTLIPQSRPMTLADLDGVPDDGHRYELIDGVLVVTPSPRWGHQDVVGRLHLLLSGPARSISRSSLRRSMSCWPTTR